MYKVISVNGKSSPWVFTGKEIENWAFNSKTFDVMKYVPVTNPELVYTRHGILP